MIGAGVRWTADCPDCGGQLWCDGGQSLHDGDWLDWGIEYDCPACGHAMASCGAGGPDDLPAGLRRRLLAERGPGRLELGAGSRVAALREVRALFGLTLAEVGAALAALTEGTYDATPPEVALLARRLRTRGSAAELGGARAPSGG